ncbi:hypothetical protein [Cetobacterium sp.]|uniref:hypothetical protein n=1 Tax=Cetobacterium sp. TaxID=2071632 RepID=UPI003EE6EFA2
MKIAYIATGYINSVNEKKGSARVTLHEADGRKTREMHILTTATSEKEKEYFIYDKETPVVCLLLPGTDKGFILGSWYTDNNKVPEGADKDKKIWKYPGGKIELDKITGELKIEMIKTIKITSPKIIIASDVFIEGDISATNIETIENLKVGGNTDTLGTTTTESGRKL